MTTPELEPGVYLFGRWDGFIKPFFVRVHRDGTVVSLRGHRMGFGHPYGPPSPEFWLHPMRVPEAMPEKL